MFHLIGHDHLVADFRYAHELELLSPAGAGPATFEVTLPVESTSTGLENV
jgi:hypothetical protein